MALFFTGVGIIVVTLAAVLLFARWERRSTAAAGKTDQQAMLPPGSMGLPYVGETLQLYSQNPNVFFATRQNRYGDIFKTNLLGCPCVMLGSPDAAHFVLVSQAHLFKPTYPASKERLIGPEALFFHQGGYHLRLRRLVQRSFAPDALRALVPDVEAAAADTLRAWDGNVASTFHAMKRLSFDVGVVTIFGRQLDRRFEELRRNYFVVEKGYNSFPNHIPGTRYQKAILARKGLRATLGEIVAERRAQQGDTGNECGLLDTLMQWRDDGSGTALTADQIADNVIGVLFAAQDTTASALTWILKYLHDDPKLLEAVKEEQMAVYEENDGGKEPLTWTQTREDMPLTHRVIVESLRMASIISFTFREAVEDVVYNGFLIPKGWKVMPLFRNIHHSPDNFKDPQMFDASRFKATPPRPGTFLPFGSGVHACPGNELAKLEMLVLVHRLVTAYRWEVVGPSDEVSYSPFPVPRHGLKARLWSEAAAAATGGIA